MQVHTANSNSRNSSYQCSLFKKKKIQLSGFSSNPGGSPSHLILISGVLLYISGPGSSVSIVTDYGLDGPGSNPGGNEIFRPS